MVNLVVFKDHDLAFVVDGRDSDLTADGKAIDTT